MIKLEIHSCCDIRKITERHMFKGFKVHYRNLTGLITIQTLRFF